MPQALPTTSRTTTPDGDLSSAAIPESSNFDRTARIPNQYITQTTISQSSRLKEYQKRARLSAENAAGLPRGHNLGKRAHTDILHAAAERLKAARLDPIRPDVAQAPEDGTNIVNPSSLYAPLTPSDHKPSIG